MCICFLHKCHWFLSTLFLYFIKIILHATKYIQKDKLEEMKCVHHYIKNHWIRGNTIKISTDQYISYITISCCSYIPTTENEMANNTEHKLSTLILCKGFRTLFTYTLLQSIFTKVKSVSKISLLCSWKLQGRRVKSPALSSDGWDQDLNGYRFDCRALFTV